MRTALLGRLLGLGAAFSMAIGLSMATAILPGAAHAQAGTDSAPRVHTEASRAFAAGLRIAIARFAGESPNWRISDALGRGLAEQPLGRLIPPEAFVSSGLVGAEPLEPEAAQIRQAAYNAAVDTVILGRLRETLSGYEIEAVLRSGHSGAEVTRHRVALSNAAELESAAAALAREILESLGLPSVAAPPPDTIRDPRGPEPPRMLGSVDGAPDSGGTGFEFGGLRGDAPIEIKAEEAEIVDRGQGRTLVFQKNVRVRQGDVTLASDRLEAEYQKGQSEPDRLIAVGAVEIGQGQRRAQCDRAIYLRVEQRLSCRGHAELLQGCDIVRGESIEFDLASEKAKVLGAASIVIRPGEATPQGCVAEEGGQAAAASPTGGLL